MCHDNLHANIVELLKLYYNFQSPSGIRTMQWDDLDFVVGEENAINLALECFGLHVIIHKYLIPFSAFSCHEIHIYC